MKTKEAEALLDALVATVESTLAEGEKVAITGFGTFAVSERAARKGRNPQTGQEIDIPACKVPRFTPGKAFKEAVR